MVADLVTAFVILVVIYVLVRPQSAAAEAVRLLADALATVVRTATDL